MRRPDWQSRFANIIREKRSSVFAFGENDCCLFAFDVIEAITGRDLGAPFRGKYDDLVSAVRVVNEYCGVKNLVAAVDKIAEECSLLEISPRFAQRGDLGLYWDSPGPALGVCVGKGFAFLMPDGLTEIPMPSIARAWRVD